MITCRIGHCKLLQSRLVLYVKHCWSEHMDTSLFSAYKTNGFGTMTVYFTEVHINNPRLPPVVLKDNLEQARGPHEGVIRRTQEYWSIFMYFHTGAQAL